MLLAQEGQCIRRLGNDPGESRRNFAECDLSGQKIHHDAVLWAMESRTEDTSPWPLKETKQKAVTACERVSDIVANRSQLIQFHSD
jgi:hypothetical protein